MGEYEDILNGLKPNKDNLDREDLERRANEEIYEERGSLEESLKNISLWSAQKMIELIDYKKALQEILKLENPHEMIVLSKKTLEKYMQ